MRFRFFCVLLSCCLFASAQDTLSSTDYYRLGYELKPGLNTGDSASVLAQLRSVAPRLSADVAPFLRKPLRDSALLLSAYYSAVVARIFQDDYQGALRLVDSARMLFFRQRHASPTLFLEKAYAEAMLGAGRRSFDAALTDALYRDLQLVEAPFRKDVAVTLKGRYGNGAAENYSSTIRSFLDGSLKDGTPMEIYNMPYMMQLFLYRELLRKHGPALFAALRHVAAEEILQQDVRVPMRDGVRLSGILFRERNSKKKVPVVIMQSPYPSGGEGRMGNIYVVNGYAMLYVDCRGRRNSEGEFFPYEHDARDYYDIIDWAVKQPWCDGKAATTGGSYLGFTQWQAIRKEYRHPALKAINPMASVGFGVDFPRVAGSFYPYILRWADFVHGSTLNEAQFENTHFWRSKDWEYYKSRAPFARFDSIAGISNPFFTRWLHHPDFDNYWKGILPNDSDYSALDIPVLTTTGYYDDDQIGALYYYSNHLKLRPGSPHYLLIGPFDHPGAQWLPGAAEGGHIIDEEAQIPLYKEVINWFNWAVKGAPMPAFFKNKAMYYDPSVKGWKGVPTLFAASRDSLRLYFSAADGGATLLPAPGRDSLFAYTHDLYALRDSLSFFNGNDSAQAAFNAGLHFLSAPLDRDYVLAGVPAARLLASISTPDADLETTWTIIYADGREETLAIDALRTRYRKSGEKPLLMQPGVPDYLPFRSSLFNVLRLPKGARIAFDLRIRDSAGSEKNWGFGGVVSEERGAGPRPIELRVQASGSYIALPVQ